MTPWFARLFDALDARMKLRGPSHKVANKIFPTHWSYLIGEVALFSFVILVLTGIFLTMFYRPGLNPVEYSGSAALFDGRTLPTAYESIVRLSHDVPGGLLFRRIHRAASHLFIAAILAHFLRVVLTGAFRQPREINYHIGILLLLAAVVSGYSGHNLPWDVLAGTSLRIFNAFLLSIPWVGQSIALWVFGGPFPGDGFAERLFVVHVLVLPAVIIGLLSLHMVLLARQTHTQRPVPDVDDHTEVVGEPMWPFQAVKSTGLLLSLGGVLALSAVLVPWSDVDLHGPYILSEASNQSQPDWFLFWVEGALRLFPPVEFELLGATISSGFLVGVAFPVLVVLLLFGYPFLDRHLYDVRAHIHVNQHPLDVPRRLGVVCGLISFFVLLTVAAGNDVVARLSRVSTEAVLWALRIGVFVVPLLVGIAVWAYARSEPVRWVDPKGRVVQ